MGLEELLLTGGPYGIVVGVLLAVLTGKGLVLPREVKAVQDKYDELLITSKERILEEKARSQEFKEIAFRLSRISEGAIKTVRDKESS